MCECSMMITEDSRIELGEFMNSFSEGLDLEDVVLTEMSHLAARIFATADVNRDNALSVDDVVIIYSRLDANSKNPRLINRIQFLLSANVTNIWVLPAYAVSFHR